MDYREECVRMNWDFRFVMYKYFLNIYFLIKHLHIKVFKFDLQYKVFIHFYAFHRRIIM